MRRGNDPQEEHARNRTRAFLERLNQAPLHAFMLQEQAYLQDPKRYGDPRADTPVPRDKLHPSAADLVEVAAILRDLIGALERGEKDHIRLAVDRAQQYLGTILVRPQLEVNDGRLRVVYEDKTENREFFATALFLQFLEYLQHYSDDVKIGICRQCEKAFLKRKRGARAFYCSNACAQKAYRERKRQLAGDGHEQRGNRTVSERISRTRG